MINTTTDSNTSNIETQQPSVFFSSPERRFPPLRIADAGAVRLGGQGPLFRLVADPGKVRLGGQGPVFRPAALADAGKVRLGGQGPLFR